MAETSHEKEIRMKRLVIGGPQNKDPNDPKYLVWAKLALRKYGNGSGQYSVLQVTRATELLVAGTLTKIDFYAVPTSSSCQCQNVNPYNLLSCHAEIWEQSWLNKLTVDSVDCN